MIKSDRFLLGIVAGVAVLVVVAFVLALRQPAPTYRTDAAPDAVVTNYLLAIQNGDYARAYGYLSPSVPGYPATVERFVDDIASQGGSGTNGGTFRVDAPSLTGSRAVVPVNMSEYTQGGPFGSDTATYRFTVRLSDDDGTWRLIGVDGDYRFWHECWDNPEQSWCKDRLLGKPAIELTAP
jgi:hypothetical protein